MFGPCAVCPEWLITAREASDAIETPFLVQIEEEYKQKNYEGRNSAKKRCRLERHWKPKQIQKLENTVFRLKKKNSQNKYSNQTSCQIFQICNCIEGFLKIFHFKVQLKAFKSFFKTEKNLFYMIKYLYKIIIINKYNY